MMATVEGRVQGRMSEHEAREVIRRVLARQGVVFGIQEDLVVSAVHELARTSALAPIVVALGDTHSAAAGNDVCFFVRTYIVSELPPQLANGGIGKIHYCQLCDYIKKPHLVSPGESVGEWMGPEGSRTTVRGDLIRSESNTLPEELGDGLVLGPDQKTVTVTQPGILVRRTKRTDIIAVDLDARPHVSVSRDRLRAFLTIIAPGPGGRVIDTARITAELKSKGITHGINTLAIDAAAAGTLEPTTEGILVAQGTEPQNGEDARLDYRVNMEFTHAPTLSDTDCADYYSLHLFENVSQGQELARVIAATPGTPGIDVYGAPIAAVQGHGMPLALGRNVTFSQSDQNSLLTTQTGHAYIHDGSIVVEQVLRIPGHVDFETGNIDFVGDVEIRGDVKTGFSIKAEGSVFVGGTVEDAQIESGKSTVVTGGFVGKGRGRIKAGQDVVVKHVRNQTIVARNNILIAGEALDANLYAGNEMFVEIRKSWIVGGSAVARKCIRAFALGGPSHAATEISVGIDLFVKKMLDQLEREVLELHDQKDLIALSLQRLESLNIPTGDRRVEERTIRERLRQTGEAHARKLTQLEKYREHYRKSLYDTNGFIAVYDTAYPGVMLRIGTFVHPVKSATQRTRFSVISDRIVSRHWDT